MGKDNEKTQSNVPVRMDFEFEKVKVDDESGIVTLNVKFF